MRQIRTLITVTIALVLVFGLLRSWRNAQATILNPLLPKTHDGSPTLNQSDTSRLPVSQDPITGESYNWTGLDSVLSSFLSRPILSYQDSVFANSKTCPTEGVNYDRNAVRGSAEEWKNLNSSKILEWRENISRYLFEKKKDSQSMSRDHEKKGTGIVMAAGDLAAIIRARTNIRLLKSYNCTLPVEIFHFSSELSDQDKKLLEDFSKPSGSENSMSVTLKTVEGVEKGNGWKQFQIKPASIQQSSFSSILYLDTDSYLLRNPTYIFEGKQWKETGLLLWPDYTKSHPTNPLWRFLGQECRDEYEGESGQIFIDRAKHQDVLWLVEYFGQNHETFYGFMGGDRDSFRAAALLLGKPWAVPRRLNAVAGVKLENKEDKESEGGGHTMLQSDLDGKWLFVHANLIKHSTFSQRPLWSRIHRAKEDVLKEGSTDKDWVENSKVGEGVRVFVGSNPRLVTEMNTFKGYDAEKVVVEDWDSYEELRGFEERWRKFGGA